MALIALVTADKVNVGSSGPNEQHTAPAAEAIVAGAPVLFDTNGKFVNSDGNAAVLRACFGIATHTAAVGEAVTVIRRGFMSGWDLTSVAYGFPVYVSDTVGRLDTVAGTLSIMVAICVPVWGQPLGTAADKILFVDPQLIVPT